jgi:energy-coupling factor transporter ATP-binding protein EcfA2
VLDEPTTGLHFEDIKKLLTALQTLVDQGNTVIVIEHNLDVIKSADHLIEMGPGGGEKGGLIVAEGTPELVAKTNSPTGVELKAHLKRQARREEGVYQGKGALALLEEFRHQEKEAKKGRPAVLPRSTDIPTAPVTRHPGHFSHGRIALRGSTSTT